VLKRRVSIAAGGGMSHEAIALALGISRVTLVKYFDHELTVGACQRRLQVLEAVHKAACKGNVAAAKAYGTLTVGAVSPDDDGGEGASPTGEGKKDRAQREARTAQKGTEWESLLKPPPTGLQ
jgi:hypothetical protein